MSIGTLLFAILLVGSSEEAGSKDVREGDVGGSIGMGAEDAHEEQAKQGQHWAVLVAGSSEYYNYRHQVCALCTAFPFILPCLSCSVFGSGWRSVVSMSSTRSTTLQLCSSLHRVQCLR